MERLYTGIIKQIIKHKNKGIIAYTDDSGIEQRTLFFNLKLKGKTREKVHILNIAKFLKEKSII